MRRREFFQRVGAAGGGAVAAARLPPSQPPAPSSDRAYWVRVLQRIADPVLTNLVSGTLVARMPVEEAAGAGRASVTHLEAVGRLIAGIGPWIELAPDAGDEGRLRERYAALTRRALERAVDPASPDFLNFTGVNRAQPGAVNRQPLVDAAFLAQGVLRAPRVLADDLPTGTRKHLIAALESTRPLLPAFNNWLLFSATVEAALARLGAPWDRMRVDYALRQHEQWYKGDGAYGDGPEFHWDYYNSFVIQPMLLDVLGAVGGEVPAWKEMAARAERRAQRYAAVLERLIAPDGTFPPIGRSLAYRFGAMQSLAQSALRRALPADVSPGQVRGALTATIRRSVETPGTFDRDGWLTIGFCGHQPGIGERYISTGSVYLCAVALLPLGLPADDPFWASPARPWTSVLAWAGEAFPIDRALAP